VPSLEALIRGNHEILCVVTQPDRKKGRHLLLEGTVVKAIAKKNKFTILQPDKINSSEAANALRSFNADLFVVIAYGQILSRELLSIPKVMAVNLHASLLPKYRGAAPISRALISGENETGVTVIKMEEKMDAGGIIAQKRLIIDGDDNAQSLEDKLSTVGAHCLTEAIALIQKGGYRLMAQDDGLVTFAPKLRKEDGLIDWNKSATSINNLIRGCMLWPGAFTYFNNKLLKIYKSKVLGIPSSDYTAGQIVNVSKDHLTVATAEDCLEVLELQIEGKRKMTSEEFISGHHIRTGQIFAKK
jgi:methionyl-tRNA formyltransferase